MISFAASASLRPSRASDCQVSNATAWAIAARRSRDRRGQAESRMSATVLGYDSIPWSADSTPSPHSGRRDLLCDLRRDRIPIRRPRGSLGAGGYIVKPRGELHSMWNAGAEPARMIEIISPGGIREVLHGAGRGDRGRRRPTGSVSHSADRRALRAVLRFHRGARPRCSPWAAIASLAARVPVACEGPF